MNKHSHPKEKSSVWESGKMFFFALIIPLVIQIFIRVFFKVDYDQLILHPYNLILHLTVAFFVGCQVDKKRYIPQYFLMLAGLIAYGLVFCLIKPFGLLNIFVLFASGGILMIMFVGATISFFITMLVQKYSEKYVKFLRAAFAIIFLGFFVYNFFIGSNKIICVFNQATGRPIQTMRIHYNTDEKTSYGFTAPLTYSNCFIGPDALYEDLKNHQAFQFFNRGLDFMNGSNAHQDSVDAKYTLDGTNLYVTLPEGHYELL